MTEKLDGTDYRINIFQAREFVFISGVVVLVAIFILALLPFILISYDIISREVNISLLLGLTVLASILGQVIEERIEVVLVMVFGYVAINCGLVQIQVQMGDGGN